MSSKISIENLKKINHEYKLFLSALHCHLKFVDQPLDNAFKMTIKEMGEATMKTVKTFKENV